LLASARDFVGQTFLSAGFGAFQVAKTRSSAGWAVVAPQRRSGASTGLENPANRQAGRRRAEAALGRAAEAEKPAPTQNEVRQRLRRLPNWQ
jgi:hypothetical protein